VEADAIVDPGAMMVHPKNAHSTDATVVTTIGFELGTPLTVPAVSRTLRFRGNNAIIRCSTFLGVEFPRRVDILLGDRTRMHQHASKVAREEKASEKVKYYQLHNAISRRDRISSHWNGVKNHVNQVETQDVDEDETHWQELQGLPEALPSVFHV